LALSPRLTPENGQISRSRWVPVESHALRTDFGVGEEDFGVLCDQLRDPEFTAVIVNEIARAEFAECDGARRDELAVESPAGTKARSGRRVKL
jgi:hypothetical protein